MANSSQSTMRCHYEVFEVSHDVQVEEIKKQYKKLALKYHPDRNPDRLEWATEQFKLLSAAYQVLSDPHERQWYDDHRDSILRGNNHDDENENDINLWPYFHSNCYDGYDNNNKGFYQVYGNIFVIISQREASKSKSNKSTDIDDIPLFGDNNSSNNEVKAFYSYWSNFATSLSFSWEDKYNINEAPNRNVRRAIEKENQKYRDTAKKAFNNLVQALVKYIKKRDPRIIRIDIENSKKLAEEEQKRQQIRQIEKLKKKEEKDKLRSKYENDEEELQRRDNERQRAFLIADYSSNEELEEDSNDEQVEDQDITIYLSDVDLTTKSTVKSNSNINSKKIKNKKNKKSIKNSILTFDGYNIEEQEIQLQNLLTTNYLDKVNREVDDDDNDSDVDDEVLLLLQCDICKKNFKSKSQMLQHLNSKSHKKNESLKTKNSIKFNNKSIDKPKPVHKIEDDSLDKLIDDDKDSADDNNIDITIELINSNESNDSKCMSNIINEIINENESDSDEDININQLSKQFKSINRFQEIHSDSDNDEISIFPKSLPTDQIEVNVTTNQFNIIKSKKKSNKKDPLLDVNTQETSNTCRECGLTAESRNKLYKHLNDTGHETGLYNINKQSNNKDSKKKQKKKIGF